MGADAAGMPVVKIYHDYFGIRGGGERLVLDLARQLSAELVFGYRTEQTYGLEMFPKASRDLGMAWAARLGPGASLLLAAAFSRQRQPAAQADIRIFSGVVAPFAAPNSDADGLNVFYCHTPPRFLYDQKAHYLRQAGMIRRLGMAAMGPAFQNRYERAVGRMDLVIANSVNIQRRIRQYLGRDSVVVYPPVDVSQFKWEPDRGYYLSTARLTSLKRIELIVDAFRAMPDKQLVVASGGDQAAALRERAKDAPNIRFAGWTSDEDLQHLIAGAIATIYIPVEEDFGMSPVESMAAGKPVIGVAEGGLVETIQPDVTGILLPSAISTEALVEAVYAMTPQRAASMRADCEARAAQFDSTSFIANMRRVIEEARTERARP